MKGHGRKLGESMNSYNEKKNCMFHMFVASLLSIIVSLISIIILNDIVDKIIVSLIGLEVIFWLYNPIRHIITHRFNIFKSSKFRKELHARFMMMLSNTCTLLHVLVIIKNPEFFLTALSFMWVLGIWIMLFDGMTSLSNL